MFGVISFKTGGQDGVIVLPRAGLGGDGVPRRPSYIPPSQLCEIGYTFVSGRG